MISSTKGETAFTETGFQNWKKALAKGKGFNKHESSECHKEVVARWCEIPPTVKGDIGEMMSTKHALEKTHSRKVVSRLGTKPSAPIGDQAILAIAVAKDETNDPLRIASVLPSFSVKCNFSCLIWWRNFVTVLVISFSVVSK